MTHVIISIKGNKQYKVPFKEGMRVLDAIRYIQENMETSLSFRWNCREGICGSCAAEVNGKTVLMCKEEIKEYMLVNVSPMKVFPKIKDLVIDPTETYAKLSLLKPYYGGVMKKQFINLSSDSVEEVQDLKKCISCFICYNSCHVIRNHPNLSFPGPINIVKTVSLDKHPKDSTDRIGLLKKAGLTNCNVTRCCQESCPQNIKITEDAIIWAKEKAIDTKK